MLNVTIRAISAVIAGILLIIYKDAMMPFIVQLLGITFLIPGIVALAIQIFSSVDGKRKLTSISLLTSVGSIAFGCWLLFAPNFLVAILMNVLGLILLLTGLYQTIVLIRSKRYGVRPMVYYYLMPLLTMLIGLFVLLNPLEVASLPFIFIGVGAIIAGISEFVNSMIIRNSKQTDNRTINIE